MQGFKEVAEGRMPGKGPISRKPPFSLSKSFLFHMLRSVLRKYLQEKAWSTGPDICDNDIKRLGSKCARALMTMTNSVNIRFVADQCSD